MSIPTRAYTPEQKKQILQRLYSVWLSYPHMRLGQLIHNAVDSSGQALFYIEDQPLIKACEDGFEQDSG
jgi:hypothetical protein